MTGDGSHDDPPIEERRGEDGEDGEGEDDNGDQEDGGDQDNDDAASVISHTSIDSALEAVGGNTKQSKNWKTRYNWPRRSRDFSRNFQKTAEKVHCDGFMFQCCRWYSTDTGSSVVPGSRAAYRLNRTKRFMGDDPVPNAIERAMDGQFVDKKLSEYIINWGFHNNPGKDGNPGKRPIITVDQLCQLAEVCLSCIADFRYDERKATQSAQHSAHIRMLKKLHAQRRSKMDSREKELEEFARKNEEEAKRLAEERKELEAWRNARAAEGASSATASSS